MQPARVTPFPVGAIGPGALVRTDGSPQEITRSDWLLLLRQEWRQGEHIAVMGRTGRGKTTLARDLMAIRGWAVALALKREDQTLTDFPKYGYRVIERWRDVQWNDQRLLFWARPQELSVKEIRKQRAAVWEVLNDVFKHGGWALLWDDIGYLVNTLGMRTEVALMLTQSRSSNTSLVSCIQQPSSVSYRIPSETWRQVRYHLVFYYRPGTEQEAIANIVGYDKKQVAQWMKLLGQHDFLAFDDLSDSVMLVRA